MKKKLKSGDQVEIDLTPDDIHSVKDILAGFGWTVSRTEKYEVPGKGWFKTAWVEKGGVVLHQNEALYQEYQRRGMPTDMISRPSYQSHELTEDEKESMRLRGEY